MIFRKINHSSNIEPLVTHSLSKLIFRNTIYNLFTQCLLVVIAIWSIPLIVKGLTKEWFGLLTLVWAFIGYFTLLDFGISRAITKFISEALAVNDNITIKNLIWTSITISIIIGVLSSVIIMISTPIFVNHIFQVDPNMKQQASSIFTLAAVGIPFMLLLGTMRGIQMALQRFDIVNIFHGIIGIFQWVGSVILIWLGHGLWEIILMLVILKVILAIWSFIILLRLIPGVFNNIDFWNNLVIKKLFSFGSWIAISQIISPLFLYIDKVSIGAMLSMTALTYYSVPQEALTRFLIIPISLTAPLFPALSKYYTISESDNKASIIYFRSLKYLFIGILPIILLLFIFSTSILNIWMGTDFASNSAIVFQILTIGLLFNSMAQIPTTALQAFGRPDIPAKFHLLELPFMVILIIILIPTFGIAGAAIAWSIRVIIDAALLFYAAKRYVNNTVFNTKGFSFNFKFLYRLIFLATAFLLILFIDSSVLKILLIIPISIIYLFNTWIYSFDDIDRNFFRQFINKKFG